MVQPNLMLSLLSISLLALFFKLSQPTILPFKLSPIRDTVLAVKDSTRRYQSYPAIQTKVPRK